MWGGPGTVGDHHSRSAGLQDSCAVFLGGLKNGVGVTVAPTRCLTASMVTSMSSLLPARAPSPSTVASAIIFFRTGDHVVEVALPTCAPLRYTGTAARDAVAGTCGGNCSFS